MDRQSPEFQNHEPHEEGRNPMLIHALEPILDIGREE